MRTPSWLTPRRALIATALLLPEIALGIWALLAVVLPRLSR